MYQYLETKDDDGFMLQQLQPFKKKLKSVMDRGKHVLNYAHCTLTHWQLIVNTREPGLGFFLRNDLNERMQTKSVEELLILPLLRKISAIHQAPG